MPISDHLRAVRSKVGHDLLATTAVSISLFDDQGRILLGRDAETGHWTLPGGAIDPNEHPADAATRECFEENVCSSVPSACSACLAAPNSSSAIPTEI